jgi:hypothetical protein
MANFIILIGGPGTYESCDPAHDKTWLNYFYPIQVASDKDLYRRGSDTVHWVVYQPAYRVRWLEDSEITFWEGAAEMISGKELHKVRKKAADDAAKKGAKNYLDRIQTWPRPPGLPTGASRRRKASGTISVRSAPIRSVGSGTAVTQRSAD